MDLFAVPVIFILDPHFLYHTYPSFRCYKSELFVHCFFSCTIISDTKVLEVGGNFIWPPTHPTSGIPASTIKIIELWLEPWHLYMTTLHAL